MNADPLSRKPSIEGRSASGSVVCRRHREQAQVANFSGVIGGKHAFQAQLLRRDVCGAPMVVTIEK